ncbi:hypothetical protein D8B26_000861 [Coccidioides posadasii str. Silveira]|uniref:Uncharacterized protein n=3 Tax=Coccidioides posadasii TaxID=199306 RepID=E9CRN1_COCPS|nr:predicted protein [Coccidioides posadasii C735 delta SOWgp]EER28849.1 predicted protein [Coccidioides posadasii C735 delta SOWgp]EFW22458.1 conserved hypothetical protein [Coccidioides posadasii str. Silveira]KMM63998.1 hypothetical protein CPAG_00350 [Coccidioides posadasii RMSCC 3488]QVM06148.1 hypothetical protein D8B26_000861 [Coccidioides posadasii str. Silveira]|eukprot:XP_003070994.1 predicted protein [Coccidioides posadasii C735 delta SOWgp]
MSFQKKIFINLPSKDLEASKRFALGLGLKKKFEGSGEMQTVVFVYADNILIMYHAHPTWERWLFEGRKTADAHSTTQALLTLSAESAEEVESMVSKAVDAGGRRGPQMAPDNDQYGMYSRSVEDPDGHVFEIVYASKGCCMGA